jgi:phosphoribosyl 1,2-cyclic phosphodiesterase
LDEKNFPTFAFKFNKFIYSSDTIGIPQKSIKHFQNCPILILDAAIYFNRQFITHLNTKQAIELGRKLKVKNLYLTQIGHSYPPYDIAEKEIKKYLKQNNIKIKATLAYDGLKIKL